MAGPRSIWSRMRARSGHRPRRTREQGLWPALRERLGQALGQHLWPRLGRGGDVDRRLDAELRDHLERHVSDLVRGGLSEADARRQAQVAFGGLQQVRESCQDVRRRRWLDESAQDLRYALRVLRRSPGFTIAAVLSLALGIGANTAIFTLLDQVLLRPLPVERPHELALVRIDGSFNGTTMGDGNELSYPMYVDFRDHNEVFAGMFARFGRPAHVEHDGGTDRASSELVSGTYFGVLGIRPALGRLLTPDDDRVPGGHSVVVLSHRYWSQRFNQDPRIVGARITVNSHPYTVIGVAEERFAGLNVGGTTHLFLPMMMQRHVLPGADFLADRRSRFVHVYGRLRPGVSLAQAQSSLQPFFLALRGRELLDPGLSGLTDHVRQEFRRATIEVVPGFQGVSRLRQRLMRPLWALAAIGMALLLIACANVAGLLLARGAARQPEIAIRLALGGSRWRILRQLIAESALLAIVAAGAGIVVAPWASALLLGLLVDPESSANVVVSPDARILAFSAGLALATGLLCGLMPAWQATRPALASTLKDRTTGAIGGGPVSLRKALVAAQVALSLLLLVGAGLFARSLSNLVAQDPGFATTNLVSFSVDGSLNGYTGERGRQFHRTLLARISVLPGVTAAGLTAIPLLQGFSWQSTMRVPAYRARPDEEVVAHLNAVTPDYFKAMGIPVLAGRGLGDRDGHVRALGPDESPFRVALANERFVERYLAGVNPIGRRVGIGGAPDGPTPIEIVGIVGNSKYRTIRDDVEPQLFLSFFEHPSPDGATGYVRTSLPPEQLLAALRQTVQAIDPALPLFRMRTMEEQVDRSLSNERLLAGLSVASSFFATLLAVVGLYGVMAYTVTRRRREIGIRMALGARTTQVTWLFLRDALLLVVFGCAVGLPALWVAGRFVRAQLFGVQPFDAATVAAAVVGLAAVAAAGALIPALRGARVDPLAVLRGE